MSIVSSGQITITDLKDGIDGDDGLPGKDGADAWTVIMSNENVMLPANAQGDVTSYANSGTSISVMYGTGTAFMPVLSSATLANNQFKVSVSASNITAGTQTVDKTNKNVNYAVTSGMNATSGAVASITYTISIRNSVGVISTVTKVQNFTKAEKGITGDKGIDSYTYIRYSASSNGANMTSLPGADSQYIGTCTTTQATAPTTAASYVWAKFVGEDGAKGDPTGITRSTTEPTTRYTGMLWQYTGADNLAATGITALPNSLYVWTGSAWQLYLVKSTNLQVDNGFITNAMIGDAQIDNAKIKDLEASKITSGEILTSRLATGAINLLRNTDFYDEGSFTGWEKTNVAPASAGDIYWSAVNTKGHTTIGINQTAGASKWTSTTTASIGQTIKAVSQAYNAAIDIRSATASKDGSAAWLRVSCYNSSGAILTPTLRAEANVPGVLNGNYVESDGYYEFNSCVGTTNASYATKTGSGYYAVKDATFRTLAVAFNAPIGTAKIKYELVYKGNINAYASMPRMSTGFVYQPYTSNSLVVDGDMIVKGSIKTEHLNVDKLSGISANLGNVSAGTYTSWDILVQKGYYTLNGVYIDNGLMRTISIRTHIVNRIVNENTPLQASEIESIAGCESAAGETTFYNVIDNRNHDILNGLTPNKILQGIDSEGFTRPPGMSNIDFYNNYKYNRGKYDVFFNISSSYGMYSASIFTQPNFDGAGKSALSINSSGHIVIESPENLMFGDLNVVGGITQTSKSSYVTIGAGLGLSLERRGEMVIAILGGMINSSLASGQQFVVGKIPVGYRPNKTVNIPAHMSSSYNGAHIDAGTDGACTWWGPATSSGYPRGTQMWFTNDALPN